MPTYEYKCKVCGDQFDIEQSFSDPTLETRPDCAHGGDCELKKVYSAVGISFKGSGFYKNDARGSSSSSSGTSSTGSTSSESSTSSSSSSSESSSSPSSTSSSSTD